MQVHYFNEKDIYTHSGELPTNPVTGKSFTHNPDVCTPDPVPEHNLATERARRVAGSWAIEPLPVEHEPEPEASLEDLRAAAHATVNAWRAWKEQQEITFEHAERTWDAGFATRNRLKPVLSLEQLPEGFFWTDADNNDVPVTKADLAALDVALELAMVQEGFRIHTLQRQMKAAIEVMTREQLQYFSPEKWPQPGGSSE